MNFSAGDIVSIRNRLWRVNSSEENILEATRIDSGENETHRFYLPFETVTAAHIDPPSNTRFGDAATNRLLIQAFRYSMVHGSAPLMSLQKSCVIPTNYQLVPVVMGLNMSTRVRMLIADDVGLGKTIEAGLLASELMSRNLASRILIICPRNLREQWQEALQYFFQIHADIISSVHLRSLERRLPPGANPWEHYKCLITSIDYIKSERVSRLALSVPWDLVIVDEAHLGAKPHQSSEKQSVSMERYNLVREVAKNANHLLFLTATPHNGYTDTYASLLDMLDCGIVSGPVSDPVINREIALHHVCQRRRKDVDDWFAQSDEANPFPQRVQKEVLVDLAYIEERETIHHLEEYGSSLIDLAREDDRSNVRTMAQWVVMHLHKRALSSPAALRKSLQNRLKRIEEKLSDKDESVSQGLTPDQAKATALDEETRGEISDEEASERTDTVVYGSLSALENERVTVEDLYTLAKKVTPAKDSKLRELTRAGGPLDSAMKGHNGPKKVIIFTRYKDTLDYLEKEIPKRMKGRLTSEQIVVIYGDMNEGQRKDQLERFAELKAGVLIATDCISEGINLQHMANQVIHYELPWNPNRLEQRNGRIDRYGQKAPVVHIRTLVMADTLDGTILRVLVEKAEKIRTDYGFAPPFFGDDANVVSLIQEMGIRVDLPAAQKTLFDSFEEEMTTPELPEHNPFDAETIERIRQESFYGQTEIDLSQVRARLIETEAAIGTKNDFEEFVRNGLSRFRCEIGQNHDRQETIHIALSDMLKVPGVEDIIAKATFDEQIALQETGIEQLNVGHPVVRRLIEQVKDSVFDPTSESYGRSCIITTPDISRVTALYHFLVRFTVGTQRPEVIEEIVPVACDLIDRSFFPEDQVKELMYVKPVGTQRKPQELIRHLSMALSDELYRQAFEDTVAARIATIRTERAALKEELTASGVAGEWLTGIDSVSCASHDLISLRLLEPARGAGVSR
ncbi:helicase-related protein [Methanogenium organophilum]|uniref:Helicase-related protein n=1 Tax=Methanogenium organophilum TaxID=2199 RepID=A0A9X9T7D3_METOG|nr:helicase-related protein [Methanogenium organophilum]WAI00954.1 helicase-related protein [Methanogenium organophilum]